MRRPRIYPQYRDRQCDDFQFCPRCRGEIYNGYGTWSDGEFICDDCAESALNNNEIQENI